jgi:hypothetical protein
LLILILTACIPGFIQGDADGADSGVDTGADTSDTTGDTSETTDQDSQEATEQPVDTEGPTGTTTSNVNCRSGPGTDYPNLVFVSAGETLSIIGKNQNQTWFQVLVDEDTTCWIGVDVLTVSGDTTSVAVVEAPPPPETTAIDWSGTWDLSVSDHQKNYIWGAYVEFVQTGNEFYCKRVSGSYVYIYNGTVSEDGMTVTGIETRQSPYFQWNFRFDLIPGNPNQFRGQVWVVGSPEYDQSYCGSRGGEPQPDPCW